MDTSLDSFLEAQEEQYESALRELNVGRKRGHWMWYVFPQLRGLGQSKTALRFGICDAAEVQRYLDHQVLGARLVACTRAVLRFRHSSLKDIFPTPDNLKYGSCMTLFALLDNSPPEFQNAIDAFVGGRMDEKTLASLRSAQTS
jgi:uncharacterized protein (DUF1810 family)